MVTTPFRIDASGFPIAGRLYSSVSDGKPASRRLLLLHGAGVAGELTWQFVIQKLSHWDEILVPDLPLMGQSKRSVDQLPAFSSYLNALEELIDHVKWRRFDLAGYSFGGLLAMHLQENYEVDRLVLIEPAALSSASVQELRQRAELYESIGNKLFASPHDVELYKAFLDVVSPGRVKDDRLDVIAIKRLQAESLGLAAGISAVGEALGQYGEFYRTWTPAMKGLSVVGGLSSEAMHARHAELEGAHDWRFESIAGTDHGLIYVRPKEIARFMNGLYPVDA